MEYRLVTQAGYPFHHIEITGFQRKLSLHNIKRNIITLWNLALSGPKAKKMMKDIQPDLVIGCGGYVSGPVVRCAAKMGIHTALHEQNALSSHGLHRSTFGEEGLNYRVRNGIGCTLSSMNTKTNLYVILIDRGLGRGKFLKNKPLGLLVLVS